MIWKNITIKDKQLIDKYLFGKETAENNFSNLFIWQENYQFQFAIEDDYLYLKGVNANKEDILFAPYAVRANVPPSKTFQDLLQSTTRLFAVTDEEKENLSHLPLLADGWEEDRDRFDYVYSISDLIRLEGAEYHSKKNLIAQFEKQYNYQYEAIDRGNIHEVKEAQLRWCDTRGCELVPGLAAEQNAILRLINNFEPLAVKGGLLRVDSKVIAFSFGEPISERMVVIHIEKGDPQYKGVYQAINQQFLVHAFPQYTYVNRECDLGIAGLRQAKQSYQPKWLYRKWTKRLTI